jgi:hypothetical protein
MSLPTKRPIDAVPYPRRPDSRPFAPGLPPGPYVYVQAADGVVWVLPETTGHLHPLVLGGAIPAAAAGGLIVGENGVIDEIENLSGTFRFPLPRSATCGRRWRCKAASWRRTRRSLMSSPIETTATATATRADDPGRWVRLAIGLRATVGDGRIVLTHASPFVGGVERLGDLAAGYDLENWESGLLSGYLFICRRAGRKPPPPLRLFELTGRLGAEDMSGVVAAAELATARLFGYPHTPAHAGWLVREESRVPAAV